jgi:hypothetical protein
MGRARRCAPVCSQIVGFPDPRQPDFAVLAIFRVAGEQFYCAGWSGRALDGWRVDAESTMYWKVWDFPLPALDAGADAQPVSPVHAARALELVTLTRPGAFGPRSSSWTDTSVTSTARKWSRWRTAYVKSAACARTRHTTAAARCAR